MDEMGKVSFGHDMSQINEALRNISNQLQALRHAGSEDSEILGEYIKEGDSMEFVLITGGLISGKIQHMGEQSFVVRNNAGRDIIVYKHAVAFIQK